MVLHWSHSVDFFRLGSFVLLEVYFQLERPVKSAPAPGQPKTNLVSRSSAIDPVHLSLQRHSHTFLANRICTSSYTMELGNQDLSAKALRLQLNVVVHLQGDFYTSPAPRPRSLPGMSPNHGSAGRHVQEAVFPKTMNWPFLLLSS